ncbi:IclR family transcriptional regulator domain-containing protein [Marinovum sp.]|uniref:IclR family transcriptional regulator domain-containing protein n=1 Tax=Marinovum sp. TaxID=2024839 RepID=UPI002B26FB65|nr:IclR family transcriptional regulator C-terminal domain-containing protein [Marinovum sp.]
MTRLVHRTVAVLTALSDKTSTLHELHLRTGIHRTTLLRILEALAEEGLVRRTADGGQYQLRHAIRQWGRKLTFRDRIVEVAGDLLPAYAERVKWPTDVLLLHPSLPCLIVVETNRPKSPFPVKLNHVGHSVPLLPSAAGRTYLAFAPETRRRSLLDRIISDGRPSSGLPPNLDALQRDLDEIRERGFGTRVRFFRGGDYRHDSKEHDGLLAMAVPVHRRDRLVAVVNTQWSAKAHNEAEFAKRTLAQQTELARCIEAEIGQASAKR